MGKQIAINIKKSTTPIHNLHFTFHHRNRIFRWWNYNYPKIV